MYLKKAGLILLAVVMTMTLVLSACQSSTAPSPSPSPTATASPKPTTTAPAATGTKLNPTVDKPLKLKLATYHPPTHWSWNIVYQAFKKSVEAKSSGRVVIEIYPSGQLASQQALFDAVRTGAADISWLTDMYYPQALPMTTVWNLPPIWNLSYPATVWFRDLYDEYFKAEHEKSNMHQIGFWVGSPYWLYTLKKPVNKVEDFKGMTLRTPSQETTDMFSILGVVPVNIAFADVFDAMQKGTMDGATGPLASIESYKWYEIGKPGYFINAGALPAFGCSTQVNKGLYDSLPADLQKILDDDGWTYFGEALSKGNDEVESGAMGRMTKVSTVVVNNWSDAEKKRLNDMLSPMWDKWGKAKDAMGLPGSKVVAALKAKAATK